MSFLPFHLPSKLGFVKIPHHQFCPPLSFRQCKTWQSIHHCQICTVIASSFYASSGSGRIRKRCNLYSVNGQLTGFSWMTMVVLPVQAQRGIDFPWHCDSVNFGFQSINNLLLFLSLSLSLYYYMHHQPPHLDKFNKLLHNQEVCSETIWLSIASNSIRKTELTYC